MTTPLVSIALVTRNGIATLPAVLDAIRRQRVDAAVEVVAVDSSSTDGTAELLRRSVDRLVTIPAQSFNHGLTRNLAIEQSRGDLVALLVQDAIPANDIWLASLLAPLSADTRVAATFARQLPRAEAGPITREYLRRAPVHSDVARTLSPLSDAELARLDPMRRLARCSLDNVSSCIRRSVWAGIPFRETPIGEDVAWAREALLAGQRVEYVPGAVVFHSHDRSAAHELQRTRALHQRLYELFELRTIPTLFDLGRASASCVALHLRLERDRPWAWPRAVALAVAWPLGQYLGGRAGARTAAR